MLRETAREVGGNLRAEWGKAWSVRAPAAWLGCVVAICGITAASLANDFVHGISTGEVPKGARMPMIDALGPAVSFAQIAVAAYAIHLVTPEYASRSIDATFLAQPRRWVVVVTKAAVGACTVLLLGIALGLMCRRGIELVLGGSLGDSVSGVAAAAGVGGVFFAAAGMGVALAFLLRSAVGALCVSVLLLVVTLATPQSVGRWLPGPAGAAWVDDLAVGSTHPDDLGVLMGWTFALLGIAIWSVRRRDV
ncbi:MAG: hypothetical protein JWN96_4174 [Mycobacterium sp.]|nr:hypothetical protein [Mycobacterium sp.]